MIFVLVHQETLQRNLVAFKNSTTLSTKSINWLEVLLRTCLISLNNNKEITCIIEHTDNIEPFVKTPSIINAPISQPLLDILVHSLSFTQEKMIWLNSQGILRGINAVWYNTHSTNHHDDLWKDASIFNTKKIDAIVIHVNKNTRMFTIIANGTLRDGLTTHQAFSIIKKYIQYPFVIEKKGVSYEAIHEKHSYEQRSP